MCGSVIVIVLGYFFFLNLILAVVVNAYQQQHQAKLRDAVRDRKVRQPASQPHS